MNEPWLVWRTAFFPVASENSRSGATWESASPCFCRPSQDGEGAALTSRTGRSGYEE